MAEILAKSCNIYLMLIISFSIFIILVLCYELHVVM